MFQKQLHTSLFFPEPLQAIHWENLALSRVKRVQLFRNVVIMEHHKEGARTITYAEYLHRNGYQVVVRIPESEFEHLHLWTTISSLIPLKQFLYAIVFGNEPEYEYDLTWSSENWGNDPDIPFPEGKAWRHASRVSNATELAKSALPQVKLISPGWKMRRITEDEPPQPGRMVWADICRPSYNRLLNGAHIYGYSWRSEVDVQRAKWSMAEIESIFHHEIWINEFNVHSGSDEEQMNAFIEFQRRILLDPGVKCGKRVENMTLFVSNGDPNTWDAVFLVESQSAYRMLGNWLST